MSLWKDFKAKVMSEEDESEEDIRAAFKNYDIDGDGYITKDEMVQVRRQTKWVWRFGQLFRRSGRRR